MHIDELIQPSVGADLSAQWPVDALPRPINRRCANKLCAYGALPMLLVKLHYQPLHSLWWDSNTLFSQRRRSLSPYHHKTITAGLG